MKKYKVALILGLVFFIVMCSKTKNPVKDSVQDPSGFGFKSSPVECNSRNYDLGTEAVWDTLRDSVLAWFDADTIWVVHKNAFENCCSIILSRVERTHNGFDVYEYDTATDLCYCLCYFNLLTTIYGVTPGAYVIRVFDMAGEYVGEVKLEIPTV